MSYRNLIRYGVLSVALIAWLILPSSVVAEGAPEPEPTPDLRHDPSLPRAEQIRRHKERLRLLLAEHRAKQEEEAARRQDQRSTALQTQRDEAQSTLEIARGSLTGKPVGAPGAEAPGVQEAPKNAAAVAAAKAAAARAAAARAKKGGAAAGASASSVAFQASRAIAYLSPFQSLVTVGDEFDTAVQLHNPSALPYENVVLDFKYDPLVVAPVIVSDAAIHNRLAEEPVLTVNSSRGRLRYTGRLRDQERKATATLLTVRWRALNPILYSEIELVSGQDGCRLGTGKRTILGFALGGEQGGGLLPGGVVVAPKGDSPRTLFPPLGEVALAGIDERLHMRLEAEQETVKAGDEWVVSLMLRNDATLPFNDLMVRIFYDPAKLQVVDWHTGNWIRQGNNIYDGFAHETYPFNVYRTNQADNETGEIVYHVGTQEVRYFPSGELARIKFLALEDASLADVQFDFENPQRAAGHVLTDVTLTGASVFYERRLPEEESDRRPAPEPLRRPGT